MGAITVTKLGKAYKQYPSRWLRLAEWFMPFLKPRHQLKWVLRDINFTVSPGEAVGIIGVNGAGKSTLLKMITGTTQPTEGNVAINGSVAALLELGMGFHPDFTGRQNVYTSAQILGLSAEQIESVMSEIEAFADIGDYMDQPVRIYSSGMQVRVAFAVATAVRPDVLIVDEALSVGDAAFQRKCHRRIESFINDGTALLFVSHDIEGVKKICDKALYIDHGGLVASGPAKEVCDQYENQLFAGKRIVNESSSSALASPLGALSTEKATIDSTLLVASQEFAYGDGSANIDRVWIENSAGCNANILESGEEFSVCYLASFNQEYVEPVIAMLVKSLEGIALYGTHSQFLDVKLGKVQPNSKLTVRFKMRCHLSAGTYFLNCGICDPMDLGHFLHRRVDVLMFKVINKVGMEYHGLVNLNAGLSVEKS